MVRPPIVVFIILLSSFLSCKAEDDEGTCKAGDDLCVEASEMGNTITLEEDIAKMCPSSKYSGGKIGAGILSTMNSVTHGIDKYIHKATSVGELFSPGWSDDYSMTIYENVGQLMMRIYKTRTKDYVNVPSAISTDETMRMGNNYVPHIDVDGTPNFLWIEKWIPGFLKPWLIDPIYVPFLTCFLGGMRALPFEDTMGDPVENTWAILKSSPYTTKKDWLLSFYNKLLTMDGNPSWPAQRMDFTNLFRNGDNWDDGVESAIAFDAIGVHRVESVTELPAGLKDLGVSELLPFTIKLNDFKSFKVRPHFGHYGVDLYFTAEGLPAALQTTDGKWIKRGDKDWQYWKFVWRSTLVTVITLMDHLYLTHFKSSGTLARSIRSALPPNHSLRRILSIFSFGAIFVNLQAQFVLVGKNAMLHRAAAFEDFVGLSDLIPSILPDIAAAPGIPGRGMEALIDDEVFDKLPAKLQKAPFYADGKLVFNALYKLARAYSHSSGQCQGLKDDVHLKRYFGMMKRQMAESHYQTNLTDVLASNSHEQICRIMEKRMAVYMFMVTAWHSHVGFVGDYYADPDLAAMSWKEGEPFGRPRQSIITSVINIFTSTMQPKLTEDYTHLFKDGLGAGLGAKLTANWHEFLADLKSVKQTVDQRNVERKIPNINMDPAVLECSVAK